MEINKHVEILDEIVRHLFTVVGAMDLPRIMENGSKCAIAYAKAIKLIAVLDSAKDDEGR